MNLTVTWTQPVPNPADGYNIYVRAAGESSYVINTAITGTSLVFPNFPPACYEGYIQSACSGSNLSTSIPFGVNEYVPLLVTIGSTGSTYLVNVVAPYVNPYGTFVNGNFNATNTSGTTNITYSVLFPANTIAAPLPIAGHTFTSGTTISGNLVTSLTPVFDNGGALQQFDSVATPQYFQFYNTSGCTSGTTSGNTSGCSAPAWTGSPISLPSFILNGFTVTTVDTSGNPLAGNILVSWIQQSIYNNGSGIYSSIVFDVYDPNTALMGTATIPYGVPGINYATIPVTKVAAPLSITSQFTMTTRWGDNSVSATALFYLPTF